MLKENAIKKIEREKAKLNNGMTNMLAKQISDMITEQNANCILDDKKTLAECKKKFDDFASKHKTGNQSVITPDDANNLIIEYYGMKKENTLKASSTVIDITDLL